MSKKFDIVKITPPGDYYLDSCDDRSWSLVRNPKDRRSLEPWACSRTLWTISKCYDEDGVYRGSAMLRGYQIVPHNCRSLNDGDFLGAG